jgi:hypothetical protein
MVNFLQQKKKQSFSVLTAFAIATFSLQLLVLLIFLVQGLNIRQLSNRKPPNFVQTIDGKQVVATDDLARNPEVIQQFVSKTMIAMFNWSGNLPPQRVEDMAKPQIDQGILIRTPQGGGQRVTTSSWVASFALSEDFRKGFLSAIADMTPPEVFATSPTQAISAQLNIKRVYPPVAIAPGAWRVGIVADLVQTKGSDNRKTITPFNKDLLVRAIDYFPSPLSDNISDIQKAIFSSRTDKLEIYEMRNLCLLDDYKNTNANAAYPCESGSFIR